MYSFTIGTFLVLFAIFCIVLIVGIVVEEARFSRNEAEFNKKLLESVKQILK